MRERSYCAAETSMTFSRDVNEDVREDELGLGDLEVVGGGILGGGGV